MVIKPPFEQRANDARSFRDMHPGNKKIVKLIIGRHSICLMLIVIFKFFLERSLVNTVSQVTSNQSKRSIGYEFCIDAQEISSRLWFSSVNIQFATRSEKTNKENSWRTEWLLVRWYHYKFPSFYLLIWCCLQTLLLILP